MSLCHGYPSGLAAPLLPGKLCIKIQPIGLAMESHAEGIYVKFNTSFLQFAGKVKSSKPVYVEKLFCVSSDTTKNCFRERYWLVIPSVRNSFVSSHAAPFVPSLQGGKTVVESDTHKRVFFQFLKSGPGVNPVEVYATIGSPRVQLQSGLKIFLLISISSSRKSKRQSCYGPRPAFRIVQY